MVSFDLTIAIQFVNFLFLMFVLNVIFFQPIIKLQKERQASLEATRADTEKKHQELTSLRENHHKNLDQARNQAFELVNAKIEAANQEREGRLAEVQAEIDSRLQAAKAELSGQESNLRQSLEAEILPLAEMIFGKLVPTAEEKEVSVS